MAITLRRNQSSRPTGDSYPLLHRVVHRRVRNRGYHHWDVSGGPPSPPSFFEGFEPTDACASTVFKTAAFGLSATPPFFFLFLSDPRATPSAAERILAGLSKNAPELVVVLGRAIEASIADVEGYAPALAQLGYEPAFGFDPKLAQAFKPRSSPEA